MAKKQRNQKKPKLVKQSYVLIKDVRIGDRLYKKGNTVRLTKEGKEYFKSINNI